jgi:hypothetical protein
MAPSIILHKRSSVLGKAPALSSLHIGELSINTADGRLFAKTTSGGVPGIKTFINSDEHPHITATELSSFKPQFGINTVDGVFSGILNGYNNEITGGGSAILNGEGNVIAGDYSCIGSGLNNTILSSVDYGVILCGQNNTIEHSNTIVLGSNITTHAENYTYSENLSCAHSLHSNTLQTNSITATQMEIGSGNATLFVGNTAVGINNDSPTTFLDISGDKIRIRNSMVPASQTAPGNPGDICWGPTHVYVCIATNFWKKLSYDNSNNW